MTKNTKEKESRGRKKIAMLLSVIGFHEDDPDTSTKIMLARLRQIQEKETRVAATATATHKSTFKKFTIKLGGKRYVKFPLQTSIPEIVAVRDQDDMDIDSTNLLSENCGSKMINMCYDQSFEENRLMKMVININNVNGGIMELKDFIKSIGGSEAELLFEKKLTTTDCDEHHGRLLIPLLQVKNPGFLTISEKKILRMRESLSVEVFDGERRRLTLNLGQWKMKNSENYVLKTKWRKLVETNGLKENMVIQVLSFRVDQQLCFAVVRV